MASIAAAIRRAFKTYPLISNCLLYGGTSAACEMSNQYVIRNEFPRAMAKQYGRDHNLGTVAWAGATGTCVYGPTLYYWYKWLDKKIKLAAPFARTVAAKCALDQFVMSPYTYVFIWLWLSTLSADAEVRQEIAELVAMKTETVILPAYLMDSCFWIPAQAINFAYIAPHHRMAYIAMCSLLFNTIRLTVFKIVTSRQ